MSQPLVNVKVHAPAGTIILNRPEERNALSRTVLDGLKQAFHDLHLQKRVRAVILTGAGTTFSSGADLVELYEMNKEEEPHLQWRDEAVRYRELLDVMLRFPKPIIAAVNGPAVEGGAGLVLASDIVVGTPGANFGVPAPRQGLVAGTVAPLLAFRLGGSVAARLLLTARIIEADEAYRLGVYHEMAETEMVWARSMEVARECALAAPEALLLTKRTLNEMIGEHLDTLLSNGAAVTATSLTTEAAAEGLAAFVEKREPKWP